jgi:hypothetical protein
VSLVLGVGAVNLLFLVAGYLLLAGPLAGRSWRERFSWSGLALLLGAGSVGTGVFFATIIGSRASLLLAALVVIFVAALGTVVRRWQLPRPPAPRTSVVAGIAFGVVAAVCALGIIGGFRSAPWLDDAWGIWLPKGLALWWHGLDPRLFVPNGDYVAFGVPDYPLWWSVVTSLDMQATRDPVQIKNSLYNIDVRVMCAQLGLLTAAFVGSVARLLWGYVRPEVLAGGLLLLVLSPELWRHVQGGVADLPLGIYVALAVLAGGLWLRSRARFHLALACFCAAVALQIKTEALLEVVALLVVGALFDRRLVLAGAALLAALPWIAWRWAHDVPSRVGDLDLSRLERIPKAVAEVAEHLFDPTEWLVIVLAFAVLAVMARRPAALLVPFALVGVIVVAYWIDRDEITYVLETSAYRVVDPVVLAAAVLLPLLAETFLQQRQALREDHVLIGEP